MYSCLFQRMARRWWSPGCTGRRQKVLFMSNFANRVPGPRVIMCLMVMSTVMYVRMQRSFGILS